MIDFSMFKSDKKLLKEIHTAFDTSGERLVREAKELLENATEKNLNDKHKMLIETGFTGNELVKQMKRLEEQTTQAKDIMSCYNHMNGLYKVITLAEIAAITLKYKLCMGSNRFYKGDIPEKNLKDIIQFKKQIQRKMEFFQANTRICAFENDFIEGADFDIKEGKKVQKITIFKREDPIVLYPCRGQLSYSNTTMSRTVWETQTESVINEKYWYVVTAWGPEASDPKIINQTNN